MTVYAPFGSGFKATVLLDRHHPVESGVPAPVYPHATYDEAAPLSSALRLPVLSSQPTPFGAFSGLPSVLSANGDKTFTPGPAPLSRLLELPVMTAEGRPTSSVIGLPAVTATGGANFIGTAAVDVERCADVAGIAAVVRPKARQHRWDCRCCGGRARTFGRRGSDRGLGSVKKCANSGGRRFPEIELGRSYLAENLKSIRVIDCPGSDP